MTRFGALIIVALAGLAAVQERSVQRLNYGAVFNEIDKCVISTATYRMVFTFDLLTRRNIESPRGYFCSSDKWKHVDRSVCEWLKVLIYGLESDFHRMSIVASDLIGDMQQMFRRLTCQNENAKDYLISSDPEFHT